jgi:hypothetical protein
MMAMMTIRQLDNGTNEFLTLMSDAVTAVDGDGVRAFVLNDGSIAVQSILCEGNSGGVLHIAPTNDDD